MRFLSSKRFLLLFLIILEIIFSVRSTLNTRKVKNWTALVENYLLKLAEDGLKTHELQEFYDGANYTVEERGLSTEGNLRFKIDWASLIVGRKFTVFALFYFVFEGNFQVQALPRGVYLEGRFNRGFFAL